jgi:uncharacterized protein with HEPN domain
MRPREVRQYLYDIVKACDLIAEATAGRSLGDYLGDPFLRAAVERQFITIGEALRQAVDQDPTVAQRIADTSAIVAFRNRLVHAYPYVDDETVWGVIERYLPLLQQQARAALEGKQ